MSTTPDGKVDALWVGRPAFHPPSGTHLIPGETVLRVPATEAEQSDNWQPLPAAKPRGKAAAADTKEG